MANYCIELHDSELAAIEYQQGTTRVIFSHAYVYQSDSIAGVDAGTGWSQRAELRIEGSAEPNLPGPFPYAIYTGALILNGEEEPNTLPIPFAFTGSFGLRLFVLDDNDVFHTLELSGNKAELILIGEPNFVETFPGS